MANDVNRQIASLSSALEQADRTLREKMDELSLVRRVGDAISHHTSSESLSAELVDAIAETLNCKYAVIYAGSSSGTLSLQAVSKTFSGPETFPAAWSEGWRPQANLASWYCVPLQSRGHLRGILCLADEEAGAFTEGTLRTLMVVVPQISSALSNISLNDHLRQSEAKYRSLVAGMQDVVYICDDEWRIVEANSAADLLFGGSIVGRTLTELFASPNTASQFVETMRMARAVQNFETEMLTGANVPIVTLLSCVADGQRRSGIIKDVTDRTRLMEQITRAQKMDSIGRLASGVAHDVNNILGIILPNAEIIKLKSGAQSPLGKFADVIISASRRAADLTKHLLSLASTDTAPRRVMSLNDAVRKAGKLLQETFDRNIRLEFDLSADPPEIKADETHVQQVLLNLAINARDAMPDGGTLSFSTQIAGGNAVMRVSDSGIGMDPETLAKIFDPFFTTKDQSKGNGLGLSIVYGIVKQLEGTIDVKSSLGAGAEFAITLPLTSEARRKSRRRFKPLRGVEKILIADDELEILEVVETAMTRLGYQVICARNGAEAVEQAGADINLIILDMIMPVMDGATAIRRIREKMPGMKILVSSGCTSKERKPALENLRIEGFVQKPFELAKLASTVRDVLDGVAV